MGTPCNFWTKSLRTNPTWLLEYLNKANFWSEFRQNRPTHIFNLWNTFSDNDTLATVVYTITYLTNPLNPWHSGLILKFQRSVLSHAITKWLCSPSFWESFFAKCFRKRWLSMPKPPFVPNTKGVKTPSQHLTHAADTFASSHLLVLWRWWKLVCSGYTWNYTRYAM